MNRWKGGGIDAGQAVLSEKGSEVGDPTLLPLNICQSSARSIASNSMDLSVKFCRHRFFTPSSSSSVEIHNIDIDKSLT